MGLPRSWQQAVDEANENDAIVVLVNRSFELQAASERALQRFGWSTEQMIGQSVVRLLHPDDLDRAFEAFNQSLEFVGPRPPDIYRLATKQSGFQEFDVAGTTLDDETGGVIFTIRELDDWVRSELLAREQVALISLVESGASVDECLQQLLGMWEHHCPGGIALGTRLTPGGGAELFCGSGCPEWLVTRRRRLLDDAKPCNLVEAQRRGLSLVEIDLEDYPHWEEYTDALDEIDIQSVVTTPLTTGGGQILGFVEVLRTSDDPPDNREYGIHDLLGHLGGSLLRYGADPDTDHDKPVTRSELPELFGAALTEATEDNQRAAVIAVQVDGACWISVDRGLNYLATLMGQATRQVLALGPAGTRIFVQSPSRFDAVAPYGSTSVGDIERQVTNLIDTVLGRNDRTNGLQLSVGASICTGADDMTGAVARAELGMRFADRTGEVAPVDDPERLHAELAAEEAKAGLRQAIESHQLTLAYEPIVDLTTLRMTGVVAHVWWQHPSRGLIQGTELSAMLGDCQIRCELDQWRHDAVREEWLDLAQHRRSRKPFTFWFPFATDHLQALLNSGLGPAERDIIDSHLRLGAILRPDEGHTTVQPYGESLRRVAGAGYELGIEAAREIDHITFGDADLAPGLAFLSERIAALMPAEEHIAKILRAHCEVGQVLGSKLVATGVETRSQLASLRSLGCTYGSGPLFGRPQLIADLKSSWGDTLDGRWIGSPSGFTVTQPAH